MAVLSVLALFLAGIIDTGQALTGFSNSTVIMIAALFVVAEGLSRTGVTAWLGQQLLNQAGSSKTRLLVVVMVGTAVLSAFLVDAACCYVRSTSVTHNRIVSRILPINRVRRPST